MNKSALLFCAALGVTGSAWAEQNSVDLSRGPTMGEYQAAMVVVRRYLAEQKAAVATVKPEVGGGAMDSLSMPIPYDLDAGNIEIDTRELTNAPFRVIGSGHVEAATVTAIAADGGDAELVVGSNLFNQTVSGRIQFQESVGYSSLCGFQYRHDGSNTVPSGGQLMLEGGCGFASPIVTYPRGGTTMFHNDIAIGGTPFNGTAGGIHNGGGFLALTFIGDNSTTCNDICWNHQMTCVSGYDLTTTGARLCSSAAGDINAYLCSCSN